MSKLKRHLQGSSNPYIKEHLKVQKMHPKAEEPYQENGYINPGYFITLIDRKDNRVEDDSSEVNTFGTGLIICPPEGYYIEVIPTQDLFKQGYFIVGPIIIEPGNKSELVIPMFKFRETEDLKLPLKAGQIVMRKRVYHYRSMVNGSINTGSQNRMYTPVMQNNLNGMQMQQPPQFNGMQQQRTQAPPRRNHMF